MKQTKRWLALALALTLILGLCACGSREKEAAEQLSQPVEAPEEPEQPEEPEAPEAPEVPEELEAPEVPEAPEAPAETEVPRLLVKPEELPEGSPCTDERIFGLWIRDDLDEGLCLLGSDMALRYDDNWMQLGGWNCSKDGTVQLVVHGTYWNEPSEFWEPEELALSYALSEDGSRLTELATGKTFHQSGSGAEYLDCVTVLQQVTELGQTTWEQEDRSSGMVRLLSIWQGLEERVFPLLQDKMAEKEAMNRGRESKLDEIAQALKTEQPEIAAEGYYGWTSYLASFLGELQAKTPGDYAAQYQALLNLRINDPNKDMIFSDEDRYRLADLNGDGVPELLMVKDRTLHLYTSTEAGPVELGELYFHYWGLYPLAEPGCFVAYSGSQGADRATFVGFRNGRFVLEKCLPPTVVETVIDDRLERDEWAWYKLENSVTFFPLDDPAGLDVFTETSEYNQQVYEIFVEYAKTL